MELLVVVLTLVATVYAVVPRYRQLDLELRLRTLDVIVVCLGSVAVLYLEFFDFSYAHGWFVHSKTWPEGITPQNTIYLVILGVSALTALRLRFAHLTAGNIHKFRDLVLELYWNEDYAELFMLIQRRLKEFVRIYESDFRSARFRARLSASRALAIDDLDNLFSDTDHAVKDKQGRQFLPDWVFRSRWLNRLFLSAMPDPLIRKPLPRSYLERCVSIGSLCFGFGKNASISRPSCYTGH